MTQGQKPHSILISAAIFIIMEIAALAMLKSSSVMQDIWINRASHSVAGTLWRSGEKLSTYFQLNDINNDLAEENAILHEQLRAYQEKEEAVRESTSIVPDSTRGFRYIPATIVKMSRNTAHNYIIINKGSADGIRPQSGIITRKGIVGIVGAVGRHYSYGLTLMNSNVSIGTRLGSISVVAPLTWNGITSDGAYVNNIPPHYTVEPGDTVRTSGYSSIFPPDLPVGVTGKTKLVDGSVLQAEVTLFQDFTALHYVTVVECLDRPEITALEKEEGGLK